MHASLRSPTAPSTPRIVAILARACVALGTLAMLAAALTPADGGRLDFAILGAAVALAGALLAAPRLRTLLRRAGVR